MNAQEFFDAVDNHPELEGVYVGVADMSVVIRHLPTKMLCTISRRMIMTREWEYLEAYFTGKADPDPLYHMSRVVGYYSRVENWNKGKLGELVDRHKGNYVVPANSDAMKKGGL